MKLEAYIRQHTTVTDFAKRLQKSRQQVHRYIRGEHLTLSIIDKIEAETGGQVTADDLRASRVEGAAA